MRDSKELAHKKRVKIADEVEKIAKDIVVIKIEACRIDSYRKSGVNLNRLEGMKMADIINLLSPHEVVVDCPDPNTEKFMLILKKMVRNGSAIKAEHKADRNHKIVGAASIIAKVEREKEIAKLRRKYGDFGPGYTSNELTNKWLKEWIGKNKEWPEIVRKTWLTAELLEKGKQQRGLLGFLGLAREKPC